MSGTRKVRSGGPATAPCFHKTFYLNQNTNSFSLRIIIIEYCHFSRHVLSKPENNLNKTNNRTNRQIDGNA